MALSLPIFCTNLGFSQIPTYPPELTLEEYQHDVEAYREVLNQSRRNGYLQLVGLMKMDRDFAQFGGKPEHRYHLKISQIPETIGSFSWNDGVFTFQAAEGVFVRTESDSTLNRIDLHLDEFGSSRVLKHDRLRWQIITRNNQPYLRIWDRENPEIRTWKGFESYPVNVSMVFLAHVKYYEEVRSEEVKSELGPYAETQFVGQVNFRFRGSDYSLQVGQNGFLMVADATTGVETYGGGRYMYIDLPDEDGEVTLDFNRLYNPPCSFNNYTTCLYPPKQNHLNFPITAGEKLTRM